jgi:DNA-binding NarL/FixJ family response regulator
MSHHLSSETTAPAPTLENSVPIRVIIADDHPIVRDGIQAILAGDPQTHVVGVATSFDDVLVLLTNVSADVLVLDLRGMGSGPLSLVTRLQHMHPDLAIVVFSSSIELAPELLQAGVRGYVIKDDLSEYLRTAIHAAALDQRFLSPLAQDYVLRTMTQRQPRQLTSQEVHVLRLLAEGLGTVQIAEQIGIDPRSVQNHITALRRKLGCRERTQLVAWYRYTFEGAEMK